MTLEQPDNLEGKKDTTADTTVASSAAEAEHSAVKKKIDIPGVGEIEYTEKVVMFPEKIVQETGGVKGYVRKMVSWEELARFFGMQYKEFEKIIDDSLHSREWARKENNSRKKNNEEALEFRKNNPHLAGKDGYKIYDNILTGEELKEYPEQKTIDFYLKSGGILTIISELTNKEFIKETFNHIVGGYGNISLKKTISKDCMFDKFLDLELKRDKVSQSVVSDFRAYDAKTNKMLEESRTMDHEHLIKQYQDGTLSKDIYLMKIDGINITDCGFLWRGQELEKNKVKNADFYSSDPHSQNTPLLQDIVVSFRPNTRNLILKQYCTDVLEIVRRGYPDLEFKDIRWLPNVQCLAAMETMRLLASNDISSEPKGPKMINFFKSIRRTPDYHGHPYIPVVFNHPNIPELRWCHADYAAIPTKNGYNIIEMIT